jgi:hypothetical protein
MQNDDLPIIEWQLNKLTVVGLAPPAVALSILPQARHLLSLTAIGFAISAANNRAGPSYSDGFDRKKRRPTQGPKGMTTRSDVCRRIRAHDGGLRSTEPPA